MTYLILESKMLYRTDKLKLKCQEMNLKDFLKRISGRDENLPPELKKNMEITGLPLASIPPPIPLNQGSGLPLSSLPPPFPEDAFVEGGMGFGVLPPPLPTPQKVESARCDHDDYDDDDLANFKTIDPAKYLANPLRKLYDGEDF